jgi:hypothetical protein
MMAEIAMKSKLLKQRLKEDPEAIFDILRSIDVLERDMAICMVKFEDAIAR